MGDKIWKKDPLGHWARDYKAEAAIERSRRARNRPGRHPGSSSLVRLGVKAMVFLTAVIVVVSVLSDIASHLPR